MGKLVKVFDSVYEKGAHHDDSVQMPLTLLNEISHKPEEEESDLVNGDVGDMSYYAIYDKKFRIIVYIED